MRSAAPGISNCCDRQDGCDRQGGASLLLLRRGGRPLIPLGAILDPLGAESDPAGRARLAPPGRSKIHSGAHDPGRGQGGVVTMRPVPSSKISIPELLPDLVHRTELLRQLDGVADVGLVSAPAGYGKTLLVAEWSRASTNVDTAWVRFDEDDNDQRRLWSAVLASVARARARSVDGPLPSGFDDAGWDMESAG